MKSFGQFVKQRLKEDGGTPLGLSPLDVGIAAKDDGPIDKDQEAQLGKLIQLMKTATQKHPEQALGFLEKIAGNDGELRSGIEALKGEMHRSGNTKFKDKGLGHLGSLDNNDGKDEIVPSFSDQSDGGGGGEGGGE